MTGRHPEGRRPARGPTASQAAGLTLGAARAICGAATSGRSVQAGAEFYGYDSVNGGRTIVFAGGGPLEIVGVLVGAVGQPL